MSENTENYYINAFDKFSGDTRKTCGQTNNELTCRKSNRTVINEVEYCGQKSENSLEAAEISNTFFSEIGKILVVMLQRRPSAIPIF